MFSAMSGAAGQLEEKLQGVSAGSDAAAWSSKFHGGLEEGGRQNDSTQPCVRPMPVGDCQCTVYVRLDAKCVYQCG